MDYKEVKGKNGRVYIFTDIAKMLMDYYDVDKEEDLEPHLSSGGEYIIHCPFCKEEGHTKHKLYVKKDFSVGHCFVCDRAYVNVTDEVNFKAPEGLEFQLQNEGPFIVDRLPESDGEWSIDRYKYEFDDFNQVGYDYLCKRQPFMKDLYKVLGFKFWDENIVLPFFYHGEPFYYQIRFANVGHDDKGIRYYFPKLPVNESRKAVDGKITPGRKPVYIIDHGQGIRKIIICEGVFDAAALLVQAPGYIPCAVLGSSINDYQINFIREYVPSKILIYMDETSISQRIANKIRTVIDYCPIGIIKSNGEDPEEHLVRLYNEGRNLQWINV